jgi:hypothetical protein
MAKTEGVMSQTITTAQWLKLLQQEAPLLQLRREGALPLQEEYATHEALYQRNPSLYALSVLADEVTKGQALRVLYHLLKHSRATVTEAHRSQVEQISQTLLMKLPPEEVLTMLLVLRREKVNHKHTTRSILYFLFHHPQRREMWASRRRAVAEALSHALGGPVTRGCQQAVLNDKPTDEQQKYFEKHLLRPVTIGGSDLKIDERQLKSWLRHLWKADKASQPLKISDAKRRESLAQHIFSFAQEKERPRTITATNRGDISATLVHMYRGGVTAELSEALQIFTQKAAALSPKFSGKIAIVLDASLSTRGYGDREYCCISQSVAFKSVLEKVCARVELWIVGGQSDPPIPQGETDLATALLDALEGDPDLALVVSDGYENAAHGDLARVLEALPGAGVTTPVVFCHSKFTSKDSLDLRRPVPGAVEVGFWHEDDFPSVYRQLFAMSRGEAGESFLQQILNHRYQNLSF